MNQNYVLTIINKYLCNPVGIYLLWIILHFVSPHMYVYLCTPATYIGLLMSPLIAPAPHCLAIRWIIYNGGSMISNMWITLAGWAIHKLLITNGKE
jgi:hypothetical protein